MSTHTDSPGFQLNLESVSEKLSTLAGIQRGIEKESLRITKEGKLSQKPHPKTLGSTLTHPNITTDYSEALLELITDPHASIDGLLEQLNDTHAFIYQNIGDELLWVNSMPCILGDDLSIPIAQYGTSNIGKMKTVYRHGLWHRYGRHMQAIAGIHFNFSLPEEFWLHYQQSLGNEDKLQDFISAQYFKLIRNFQRYSWLIVYLFGASPAVCASFVKNKQHRLQAMNSETNTFHLPNATSLRMSDLGYQNDAQSDLMICYNSLETYTSSLERAIKTPYAPYEKIGVKVGDEYKQLNANILQIENEYYSNIRPKRPTQSNERPTQALRNRGVEYIEVRSLDLNPFETSGLDKDTIHFLDAFLLFCLLQDDIQTSPEMLKASKLNIETVVYEGRNPAAEILNAKTQESESLTKSAHQLLDGIEKTAALFDKLNNSENYKQSLSLQRAKIDDSSLTPSGKVINILKQQKIPFFRLAMNQAEETRDFFLKQNLSDDKLKLMRQMAEDSIEEQKRIEQEDDVDFDTFVANYFKD